MLLVTGALCTDFLATPYSLLTIPTGMGCPIPTGMGHPKSQLGVGMAN